VHVCCSNTVLVVDCLVEAGDGVANRIVDCFRHVFRHRRRGVAE
jgi:hypothetical protein